MATQVTLNSGSVDSAGSLALKTNGTTTAVTIDTAQNMGLGVTPSAWGVSFKSIDVNTYGAVSSSATAIRLFANSYGDGTNFIYKTTGAASRYDQSGGAHSWLNAASGTAGNTISFTTAMTLDSSGNLGIGTTSPTQKLDVNGNIRTTGEIATSAADFVYSWAGGTTGQRRSGFYLDGSNQVLRFYTAQAEVGRFDSSGNLLVGTTSADGRITVHASTSNSSSSVLVGNTSAGNTLIRIRADGLYNLGLQTNSPYNFTSTGANAILFSDGTFGRATSSLKYKRNVETATHGLSDVLKLRSVTYKSKNERDGETIFGGLIAEEVHEIGLTEFVQYAEDGTPDSLYYANMVSLCIKAIQEQQALITTLTDRITALEAK